MNPNPTPNIEHIDEVIAAIKAEEIAKFDMSFWFTDDHTHPCGTAACIAGFSCLVSGESHVRPLSEDCRAFGITEEVGHVLFTGYGSRVRLHSITVDMAIRALEDLKENKFKNWENYL